MRIRATYEIFLDPIKEWRKIQEMQKTEGYTLVCESTSLFVFRKIDEMEVREE